MGIIAVIFQLSLLAWTMYQIYVRFRGTQAERILRGLIIFVPILLLCYVLKLSIITKIFEIFSQTFIVGLIVIFAPEFRRVLIQLGGEFNLLNYTEGSKGLDSIQKSNHEIIEALQLLQKSKKGALIIIEKAKAERYYINPGFVINSDVSKELLVTIFSDKSPLHDGAVIVRGSKIAFAAVILPMTENPKLDWQYGTRHRAAIGFSEVTDAMCFVVSEETGDISIAIKGKLKRYDDFESIEDTLNRFYSQSSAKRHRRARFFHYMSSIFNQYLHQKK
ncbi:MAG: diadenylate cyclase CdaA [Candidatus Caenarcaniphilales bacterium]|nr:diadenylate cyclase CdaA [Candidatus Caenarcaniphilales bacterium]